MMVTIDPMDTSPQLFGTIELKIQRHKSGDRYRAILTDSDGTILFRSNMDEVPFHCRMEAISWLKRRNFCLSLGLPADASDWEIEQVMIRGVVEQALYNIGRPPKTGGPQ